MFNVSGTGESVSTGTKDVAELLGGGIRPNSLVVVIGESKTGKSVFCQHLAFNALQSRDNSLVYYTSMPRFTDVLEQMDYFSMDARHTCATDRFRIVPMSSFDVYESKEKSLAFMLKCIDDLPKRFSMVIVDSVTTMLYKLPLRLKMDVFEAFKKVARNGRSLVVVTDSFALEKQILTRLYLMSDYYIRLAADELKFDSSEVDDRSIKLLQLRKLGGAENPGGNNIKFEVKPEAGIQILPFIKVHI